MRLPAASRTALMLPSTRSTSSSIVPRTSSPVAGSSGICPDRNSRSPERTAWLYGPMARGARAVVMVSRSIMVPPVAMAASGDLPLDVIHAFDALEPIDDPVQVLDVADVQNQGDLAAAVLEGPRLDVPDVRLGVGNGLRDPRQDAGPILREDRQTDLELRLVRPLPDHLDPALGIVEELLEIGAAFRVDRHTPAARDVAHDRLATDRVAAARQRDE